MIYNRQWLRDQLTSYLRDSNIDTDRADNLIDLAVSKVGIVLESQYNESMETFSIASTPWQIPSTINAFRTIVVPSGTGGYSLQSMPSHRVENYGGSGSPVVYGVKGNQLLIAPFQAKDYEVTYFRHITLAPESTATDEALTHYPFVFMEAMLSEGYAWKEDMAGSKAYEQKFLGSVQEINRVSRKLQQGDSPAMRMN